MNKEMRSLCVDLEEIAKNLTERNYDEYQALQKAIAVVRAVFDPENQPSQYGTQIMENVQ